MERDARDVFVIAQKEFADNLIACYRTIIGFKSEVNDFSVTLDGGIKNMIRFSLLSHLNYIICFNLIFYKPNGMIQLMTHIKDKYLLILDSRRKKCTKIVNS